MLHLCKHNRLWLLMTRMKRRLEVHSSPARVVCPGWLYLAWALILVSGTVRRARKKHCTLCDLPSPLPSVGMVQLLGSCCRFTAQQLTGGGCSSYIACVISCLLFLAMCMSGRLHRSAFPKFTNDGNALGCMQRVQIPQRA